ncbi:LCP family protein [Candidatus Microgenomates bacterium]|nr:LCP family protein [Candidatus Microgenomates bacterium]
MKKKFGLIIAVTAIMFIVSLTVIKWLYFSPASKTATNIPSISTSPSIPSLSPTVTLKPVLTKPVNILLLGLDGRRGDKNPRCDAIHIFSIIPSQKKLRITSIPRGTSIDLPQVGSESAYLSNSCHLMGIKYAVSQIEKITKLKIDYLVKINFSQTLGVLRILGIPESPSLQFLRNRRYLIGDNQRSRNQALFLKDMIISHLSQIAFLPKALTNLLYTFIDTDLDFETASLTMDTLITFNLPNEPGRIELVTKPIPNYKTSEIHFFEDEYKTGENWQSDKEYLDYQNDMEGYLTNLTNRLEKYLTNKQNSSVCQIVKTPFTQQLWLQIGNEGKRNQFHFEILRYFVLGCGDKNGKKLVSDFVSEMEIFKQEEFINKGKGLLGNL